MIATEQRAVPLHKTRFPSAFLFFECFSLCLSRVCLGKLIVFYYNNGSKEAFFRTTQSPHRADAARRRLLLDETVALHRAQPRGELEHHALPRVLRAAVVEHQLLLDCDDCCRFRHVLPREGHIVDLTCITHNLCIETSCTYVLSRACLGKLIILFYKSVENDRFLTSGAIKIDLAGGLELGAQVVDVWRREVLQERVFFSTLPMFVPSLSW